MRDSTLELVTSDYYKQFNDEKYRLLETKRLLIENQTRMK